MLRGPINCRKIRVVLCTHASTCLTDHVPKVAIIFEFISMSITHVHVRGQSIRCHVVLFHILGNQADLALAAFSRSIVLRTYVLYPERPTETDSPAMRLTSPVETGTRLPWLVQLTYEISFFT